MMVGEMPVRSTASSVGMARSTSAPRVTRAASPEATSAIARACAASGQMPASDAKKRVVTGVSTVGSRCAPITASARPSRAMALPSSGIDACPSGPFAVTVTTCETFSAICRATYFLPFDMMRVRPPSLSAYSARMASGWCLSSQPMPKSPPASSSALATKITSRESVAPARTRRCSAFIACRLAMSMPLSSIAPRPVSTPSVMTAAKGSTVHWSRCTPTTSMWPMRMTGDLAAAPVRPRIRATTAPRPGADSNTCDSMPSALNSESRNRADASSLPGGLVVLMRISACSCCVASRRIASSAWAGALLATRRNRATRRRRRMAVGCSAEGVCVPRETASTTGAQGSARTRRRFATPVCPVPLW